MDEKEMKTNMEKMIHIATDMGVLKNGIRSIGLRRLDNGTLLFIYESIPTMDVTEAEWIKDTLEAYCKGHECRANFVYTTASMYVYEIKEPSEHYKPQVLVPNGLPM